MDSKLILIDVDGVLNPEFRNTTLPEGFSYHKILSFGVYLNPKHAEWLIDLSIDTGAQLCWGTTWEQNANEYIAPIIGLPELPVMRLQKWRFSSTLAMDKAYSANQFANGRKFVYFDDERDIGSLLKGYYQNTVAHHIWVDPSRGLTEAHIEKARNILKG